MLSNIAYKFYTNPYLSFFQPVHNPLFAYLDFINQTEKRFPVKAFQIAVLPDKVHPFLHIILHRLAVLYLLFQFPKPGGFLRPFRLVLVQQFNADRFGYQPFYFVLIGALHQLFQFAQTLPNCFDRFPCGDRFLFVLALPALCHALHHFRFAAIRNLRFCPNIVQHHL